MKDGKPFRFVGGSMQYFRVPRAYWGDRLRKLRMGGLNVVDFYIDWSGHEPESGHYNFRGNYDLDAFIREVKKAWPARQVDNAAYPYWLVRKHPDIRYRTLQKVYTQEVTTWFNILLPRLAPHLYKNGGPIILVQLENEYGHLDGYCEPGYMEFMLSLQERLLGKDVVMFRSDSPEQSRYDCDRVRDILVGGNCYPKTNVIEAFKDIRKGMVKKGGPILVPEYYTGWMDYWGWNHNKEDPKDIVRTFKKMMDQGANVIFYLYHGGTSFGFKAGTSAGSPLVTSYDYNAPLAEDGDPRPVYFSIRKVIERYMHVPSGKLPRASPKLNIGAVALDRVASLDDVMQHFRQKHWLKRRVSQHPMTFEEIGQDFGFVLYTTKAKVPRNGYYNITLHGLRDRAQLFVRNERHLMQAFVTNDKDKPKLWSKVLVKKEENLSVLVENQGRECFGPKNKDPKGVRYVTANGVNMTGWTTEAVPVTRNRDISELMRFLAGRRRRTCKKAPCFVYGSFVLPPEQRPLDTFLDPSNYTKGVAFVNGINVGRYWPTVGPQVTLYVPGVFLRPHPEQNLVVMMEVDGVREPGRDCVSFVDKPLLDADL
ncbi:hypothetical protein HPB48_006218 [Haemaphysalis longicornis]|uniref:Beta-galactosidase n=1 Tax=Haemaphysalis longicornis TaxID=44386 RepID=A0A9J6FSY1_HAELO|nr:hypothetical protein HPB48_006218 [Haemaphysalis longicornis]